MNDSEKIIANHISQERVDASTNTIIDLIKGKAVPVGTVRGNMIKTAGGWKYNKKGKTAKVGTKAKEASKEGKKPTKRAPGGATANAARKILADPKTSPITVEKMISKVKTRIKTIEKTPTGMSDKHLDEKHNLGLMLKDLEKQWMGATYNSKQYVQKSEEIIINFMKSKNE